MSATESASKYTDLEKKSTLELLQNINNEDASVHLAVEIAIPQIERTVDAVVPRMKNGGRLFYIGAGFLNQQRALFNYLFDQQRALFNYLFP